MSNSKPTAREFLFENLRKILGDGGLAERHGLRATAEQRDYSQRWCEAICRSIEKKAQDPESPASVVLSSADTGTGKTIGYAVPLMLRAAMGVKVGISTHSHMLQRQFLGLDGKKGDLTRIAEWIHEAGLGNLKIRRRLGRQAFISLAAVELVYKRMNEERQSLGVTLTDLAQIEPLITFAMESNAAKAHASGLIEDLLDELGGDLPLGITATSICLGADSSEEDSYRYMEHLEDAESADVVIFSHAYMASCALYRKGKLLDNPIDSLVIDEADRLVDVAESAFRFEVSLRRSAKGFENVGGKAGAAANEAIKQLADYVQSLHETDQAIALDELGSSAQDRVVELAGIAHRAMSSAIASLQRAGKVSQDVIGELLKQEAVLDKFVQATRPLKPGEEVKSNPFVAALSFSPVHSLPSISVMPHNPGWIIARLWNLSNSKDEESRASPVQSVLLTSATLGVPGHFADATARFKGIAQELGISITPVEWQRAEFDLWASFEPEKFGRIRFILADPATPSPTADLDIDSKAILSPEWVTYATSMILQARKSGGRSLVLCNSYNDVACFSNQLIAHGVASDDIIEQMRNGSPKDCQNRFIENPTAIWFSPTAWEGLNLPGLISNLVVLRIPFTARDATMHALLRSLGRYTNQQVQSIVHAKMMNSVKRKLRQGFGRPIRKSDDQASIWIADPRFPMHPASQIPLRFPGAIKYSSITRYESLHAVVPRRFQRALENATVLLQNGEMLR